MHGQFKEDRSSLPDLQRLKPIHHEIIRHAFLGYKRKSIALLCNVTEQTVSNTLNSTEGQAILSDLNASQTAQTLVLKNRISELRPKALKTIVDFMEDDNVTPAVRSSNAKFLIDISGLRVEQDQGPSQLTAEEIEDIKKIASETRRSMQKIRRAEDTIYTEVSS